MPRGVDGLSRHRPSVLRTLRRRFRFPAVSVTVAVDVRFVDLLIVWL